jgi:hypothetical protein
MNTNRQRTVVGEFRGRPAGPGAWRLTTSGPQAVDIHLGGMPSDAAERLRGTHVSAVAVAWHGESASLRLNTPEGSRSLKPRTAIIHEPLPRLYEALPLASLDDRARRFWRRVFFLVRIPGGRRLLGLVARRSGRPK